MYNTHPPRPCDGYPAGGETMQPLPRSFSEREDPARRWPFGGLRDTPLFLVVVVVVVVVAAAVNGVMLGVVSIEKPNYTKSPRELSTW